MTDTQPVILAPLKHSIGERVSVVGGGGKSTLARAICAKYNHSYIELDSIHWMPNWVERNPEDERLEIYRAIDNAGSKWVVDGNYFNITSGAVISRADTVIFVNMPWSIMFWRVFLRSVKRAVDKKKICGDNYESFRQTFLSKESLLLWHIQTRDKYKNRRENVLKLIPSDVPLIELSTPKELDMFYKFHGLHIHKE